MTATGISETDAALETLLASHAERPVFVTPAWLRTWFSEFGEGLEPVLVECANGQPLAVAPLMRDCDGRLTFIGDPNICDYMDVVVDAANSDAAYAALWQHIAAEEWTELELWGLPASSPTRDAVKAFAAQAGYELREEHEAVAPRLELPATFEAYVESLNKKDRHELRRKLRRLLDSGANVQLDVFSEQREVVAGLETFLDLHTRSRMDKTEFMTPAMASFFRRMASALSAEGLIRLFQLSVDGKAAAAVLCFDAGSYLYMYNSGYDPAFAAQAVGLVSKVLCLRWAIENGKQGLDFLRGNEPYKYDLGAKDQDIYRIVVQRPA